MNNLVMDLTITYKGFVFIMKKRQSHAPIIKLKPYLRVYIKPIQVEVY
jgi:hypothetical protein